MSGSMRSLSFVALAFSLGVCVAVPALAETGEVRIAQQFGIAYLPYDVMRDQKLIEKAAVARGLPEPKVTWTQFSGGGPMNEALLSDSLDFATSGVAPAVTIWAKTAKTLKVKSIASLGSLPSDLNTNRPEIKTVKDFTDKDRIAFPSVKVGVQAALLQMAAEQAFGPGQFDRLDRLTISMAHPDATIALLSGKLEVTANFTTPPFLEQQLRDPKIHRVISSYDILGGPHTLNLMYGVGKFYDANPKTVAAILDALDQAMDFINKHPKEAAAIYTRLEKSTLDPSFVEEIVTDPRNRFTTTPEKVLKFVEFQHRTGQIPITTTNWKDLFFPPIHDRSGS